VHIHGPHMPSHERLKTLPDGFTLRHTSPGAGSFFHGPH
jgi:hypothetical protein